MTSNPPHGIRRKRSISPPVIRRKCARSANHVENVFKPDLSEIKIYSWNVNGVGPLLQKKISFQSDTSCPIRTFLRRHNWPHFLFLQEVKINRNDNATQRRLQLAANEVVTNGEPTYEAHFSLPRDKFNATGFGGKVHGVATLIRHDLTPDITATRCPDWDLEGRVLIHEIKGQLVVINGYWVNGTSNPYRDPTSGIVSGTRHDHKLRFHQHMLDEVLDLEKSGASVILAGDMNVARARIDGHPNLRTSPIDHVKNRADFNAKFFTDENGMKGVDVFRHLHGDQKKFTYYSRGRPWGESCDRVDLIIISRHLLEGRKAHINADICDNALDRGHSDHVPLWISVRIPQETNSQVRGLNSRARNS